jgi:hypothetical protein
MSWTRFVTCVLSCMNQQKMCESACEKRKAREEAARELRGCGELAISCENRLARFAELVQVAKNKWNYHCSIAVRSSRLINAVSAITILCHWHKKQAASLKTWSKLQFTQPQMRY